MASIWKRQFTRQDGADNDTPLPIADLPTGDSFAQWLSAKNRTSYRYLDQILSDVNGDSAYNMQIFAIGDGSYIDQTTVPGGWFNPHVRLLAVIAPNSNPTLRFFAVGPLDVQNPNGFLQVASWDGKVFHFYAVEDIGASGGVRDWTYQANSLDAFTDGASYDASYLGPFNGHVNGGTIMKEIHAPWYHWLSASNPDFIACLSTEAIEKIKKVPYLIGNDGTPLGGENIVMADELESIVEESLIDWYGTRVHNDFCDPKDPSNQTPLEQPKNIHRWMAHLLLTTTVNFAASATSGATTYTIPNDHFYNQELLSQLTFTNKKKIAPDMLPIFKVNMDMYESAVQSLRLSLLQEVVEDKPAASAENPYIYLARGTLGGGKQTDSYDITTFVETLPNSEGVPFVCLQTSIEDAQGVLSMQKNIQGHGKKYPKGLLSDTFVQAILMVDFCNPVYSWRRGVLMRYLPSVTSLTQASGSPIYDLEQQFVAEISKSTFTSDADSPESRFLLYYNTPPADLQKILLDYFSKITKNLKTQQGIYNYLMLAESRRRLYRPLPLDEFGAQLPYALALGTDWQGVEMNANGGLDPIPQRGLEFFQSWMGSLHGYDPHILPSQDVQPQHTALRASPSRCPVMRKRSTERRNGVTESAMSSVHIQDTKRQGKAVVVSDPTWDGNVRDLFAKPYWVSDPVSTGQWWISAMGKWSPETPKELHLDLSDPGSVQYNVVTIYQHLRSKSMPITDDPSEYWPEEALETLRNWANQGFRTTSNDPISTETVIPVPNDPPLKLRKDILSLTSTELQTYREKLDTVLNVGNLDSKWQELGLIHAEWCLHYQEATFFWHRAYLNYVESLIDFPIPYWNGFAADTSDINSPHAGLPSIFLEESYINSAGETRPNPLKHALAYNGKNKNGTGQYVERYAALTHGPDPKNPEWVNKVHLFDTYHKQIAVALSMPKFSVAEDSTGTTGLPWANIGAFTDNQDPSLYPNFAKDSYFDGNFELAHDNYHGWVGPDMADNTYTAFDPIFLSYHANMDRIVEMYIRQKPNQQLTSNFPLQPFLSNGTAVSYTDPRKYAYTTTGDMAKPTQALGYLYAPPATPDYINIQTSITGVHRRMKPAGGSSLLVSNQAGSQRLANANSTSPKPRVVFNIGCSGESYQIDVFVSGAKSLVPDPVENPDFIGRVTRLGMGPGRGPTKGLREAQSCRKATVARVLDASHCQGSLQEARGVQLVVTDLQTGEKVEEAEWKGWNGFEAKVIWL
ncbi:hypothetical protein HJFPF1_00129 [Paramyrothecium foliicola]|nr:hypothetical protein HJFPF1_00129 [Paramyrothecium foliicola]